MSTSSELGQFCRRAICLVAIFLCCLHARAEQPVVGGDGLAKKAERFQQIVETKLVEQHGMIPMFVRASDYQLPTAEDYQGAYRHRHLRGKTEAELGMPPMHVWRAWENTATDTAYYLRAVSYQYRVTGDPKALAICRRTLAALKYIYTLPIAKGERGFLCKPYGGEYTTQSSSDQLQCVCWGLAAYRPIAPAEDVADIDLMTKDFARFQLKTDYLSPYGYFGRTREELRAELKEPRDIGKATIFLPLLYLAWQGSGDAAFADEIERWNAEVKSPSNRPTFQKFSAGAHDPWRNLYLPTLLIEWDPARHEVWRQLMEANYIRGHAGLLKDGTWPTRWSFDAKAGAMKVVELPEVGGYGRSGRSAIFAMSCVAAQRWCPDLKMKEDAHRILDNLDEKTFRFVMQLDNEHPLPPEWQVETKMLDSDSLTAWLSAYWEGRFRNYW